MKRSGDFGRATSSADSSGEEEELGPLVIDEGVAVRSGGGGVARKRRLLLPAAEDAMPPPTPRKPARRSAPSPLDSPGGSPTLPPRTVATAAAGIRVPGAAASRVGGAAAATRALLGSDEQAWQRAMDLAVGICVPLKVDVKGLTLLPDAGTLECLRKACQAWLNESKVFLPLTYSTHKSVLTVMARFLLDFILRTSGLNASSWSPTGCVVWRHQCTDGEGGGNLHCLHGLPMLSRDHVIEMDVNSENGQRALKETPHKTKITTNRWNRNVVQLRHDDAACCQHDAALNAGTFSGRSCGMFYSEAAKALQAFQQIMAFQRACYPKMQSATTHLLMPIKCDCNWGQSQLPLLGRQVCKVTPFSINAGASVDKAQVEDPKLLASVEHPSVLVFQCCNPVYRQSRANAQRNCDFKISAPDMIAALQLVKQMWAALNEQAAPVTVPEFRWDPAYQHQNVILPMDQYDADESLF
ncbi:DNA binding protein [Ovine adenovirus 8]|uniref:DNA-binding protein n=1 Tax=Ovine adenovirus 8 TaxID=2601527 RepID=A0A5B8MDM9_9ADEN|nr:DNA binding protein [Ovine adenovirus 8]QDZ17470.1 DNA binding protein [Ovine adenovirus 8]